MRNSMWYPGDQLTRCDGPIEEGKDCAGAKSKVEQNEADFWSGKGPFRVSEGMRVFWGRSIVPQSWNPFFAPVGFNIGQTRWRSRNEGDYSNPNSKDCLPLFGELGDGGVVVMAACIDDIAGEVVVLMKRLKQDGVRVSPLLLLPSGVKPKWEGGAGS